MPPLCVGYAPSTMMQGKKSRTATLAGFLVLNMLAAGCFGMVDTPEERPTWNPTELPDEWWDVDTRARSSPNLHGFGGCDQLELELKTHIAEEMRVQLLQMLEDDWYYGGGIWMEDDMAMAEGAPSAGAAADGGSGGSNAPQTTREEGTDYSGTNNQEEGVDEADFVKTDGFHIYILQNSRLFILGVPEYGELISESNMSIEGSPQAMMLADDHLVILSTVNAWNLETTDPLYDILRWDEDNYGWWRTNTVTKLTVIDIGNRSAPEVDRELYIEGYYQTAREVGGTVRMVTHGWMDIPGLQWWLNLPSEYWSYDWEDPMRQVIRNETVYNTIISNQIIIDETPLNKLVPQVYERIGEAVITHPLADGTCDDFVTSEDSTSRAFTSIFTLDLMSSDFSFEADHLLSNWAQVYASQDVLLIAETANDWWWFWGNEEFDEATNIHSFNIGTPGVTEYTGSGRVDGNVLDQFSLSEHNGTVRVATTTGQWGRWWMSDPAPMENHVVTLQRGIDSAGVEVLEQVGHVGGIALEESIWSTRFVGDICYMVTFRNMDPLWTIDLSDPTNPTILGELEVPGVSTYIHPMADGYLLTIGLAAANADGTGLDWGRTQVSQFNVTNLSDPTLLDAQALSPVSDPDDNTWNWGWSEATYEHKAFQYWEPKEMLAIPLSTYRSTTWYDSSGNYRWSYQYVSQLVLLNAAPGENLSVHGTIDHSDFYNTEDHYWWGGSSIRRTIFMGDYVYAISPAGVTAHELDSLNETASVQLWTPQHDPYTYYDDVEEEVEGEGESDTSDSGSSSGSSEGSSGNSTSSDATPPTEEDN